MTAPAEMAEAIDMIRQSAEGIAPRDDLGRVRALRFSAPGFDPAVWREMCTLGWPLLRLQEDQGGVGLPMAAYAALAEELGAGLVPEPLVPAMLVTALLRGPALEAHISGQRLVLPAWQDAPDAAGPTSAGICRNGRLYGTKRFIPVAGGADAFLVIGTDGQWLVDAAAPGCTLTLDETQDGATFGTLVLEGAAGEAVAGDAALALAEACLASAAYLLGIIDAVLERTAEFLKARVQFGKPLASFQVLQHRLVDLKLEAELTRASIRDAAQRIDREGLTTPVLAAISRAKARAGDAAMLVTRSAVQLHGGIGYTDEHDIGLYLRKAMVVAPQYGSAALHRARYAALVPLAEEI